MYLYRPKFYAKIQFGLDLISFWPIWAGATQLRIELDPITSLKLTAEQAHGWVPSIGFILLLWAAVSLRLFLYKVPRAINARSVLVWAGENTIAIFAVTVLSTFFTRQFGAGASRIFVFCVAPVAFFILTGTRCLALGLVAILQRKWHAPRIALIGDSVNAKRLMNLLEVQIGSAVRGLIVPEGTALNSVPSLLPVLGTTGQIAELVNRERIDRVIMINSSLPNSELERCSKVFWRMGLPVSCTLDFATEPDRIQTTWISGAELQVSNRHGLQMVDLPSAGFSHAQDLFKTVFDIVVSLCLLIVFAPVMLLLAVLVKLSSKGPILERAPRVGKGGRHFTCLKFRTTFEDLSGPADFKVPHREQRVTPVGRVLREYGLDELPQLINILRSEMSLVGPRPLPAHELGLDGMSREFSAWSETRARVRPGLTGLWQVSGRNSLSFGEMIRLDLEYVQKRSLALDLILLLRTPLSTMRPPGDC
jgi:lipopolysaccharide/colanic/teichoic acid biosynthesis glycosyltransferase